MARIADKWKNRHYRLNNGQTNLFVHDVVRNSISFITLQHLKSSKRGFVRENIKPNPQREIAKDRPGQRFHHSDCRLNRLNQPLRR
jgi:hypothetical protein